MPDRPGLEYFMSHEESPYGSDLRDARTGEILFRNTADDDTGRGLAADIDSLYRGSEMWSSAEKKVYNVDGTAIAEPEKWIPQNFRIYWDGDLYDELLGNGRIGLAPGADGREMMQQGNMQRPNFGQRGNGMGQRGNRMGRGGHGPQMQQRQQRSYIAKWNGNGVDEIYNFSDYGNSTSCNGTKATPCLQADLFGDWREEIIFYDSKDKSHLNIFTTIIPTAYRVPTLMHDHVYRMGIAWQNVAYNQPPHLSYYLPDIVKLKKVVK